MTRHLAIIVALAALLAACSPATEPTSNEGASPKAGQGASAASGAPSSDAGADQAAPSRPDSALAIDGGGLLFDRDTGAARLIPFGTPREALLTALAARGSPDTAGMIEECGAGPLEHASWADGLTLYFQDSKFAGWALSGDRKGALTTASGIGLGSTRAELVSAYSAKVFESTLGTEFEAGDIFGLLDGPGPGARARITNLWAGASCNMR